MKVTIQEEIVVDFTILKLYAGVRSWHYTKVNNVNDTTNGDNIPCKEDKLWCPIIEIDTGKIVNWKQGTTASIYYKVNNRLRYEIMNRNGHIVAFSNKSFVSKTLCAGASGYEDDIIMNIDENGMIQDWEFEVSDFVD